jgi:glycosyltransferase involved in cell wall biosynthesis
MLKKVSLPVVVSLHEVYEEYPGIYPRSRIRGSFPVRLIKTLLYDLRHPVQHTFTRHAKCSFYADRILVHHRFHIDILRKKITNVNLISVFPLPVISTSNSVSFSLNPTSPLRLGALGFINPQYDYDLLFSSLELMNTPWTFTWIGGLRTDDQQCLLDDLHTQILRRNWQKRFFITGWVSENEMQEKLNTVDCILALFKTRSSSDSLARSLGAGKPIIAADIPLTAEIAHFTAKFNAPPPLILSAPKSTEIMSAIEHLISNPAIQRDLLNGLTVYKNEVSYTNMARKLLTLYGELVHS